MSKKRFVILMSVLLAIGISIMAAFANAVGWNTFPVGIMAGGCMGVVMNTISQLLSERKRP